MFAYLEFLIKKQVIEIKCIIISREFCNAILIPFNSVSDWPHTIKRITEQYVPTIQRAEGVITITDFNYLYKYPIALCSLSSNDLSNRNDLLSGYLN